MTWEHPLGKLGVLTAGADLSAKQYCFAKHSGTNDTVTYAAAGTDVVIGVIQNKPASGEAVELTHLGVSKVLAGAVVASGARVMPDSAGKAITATTAGRACGIALVNAAAADELIPVLLVPGLDAVVNGLVGVSSGYKLARGQATTASATDTVVTGLATVVATVASFDDDPADANLFVSATIGDQNGAPAAGSIIIKTWKTADGTDPTPVAATSFSKKVNWIAIGT